MEESIEKLSKEVNQKTCKNRTLLLEIFNKFNEAVTDIKTTIFQWR
jgi:hypothetical protein